MMGSVEQFNLPYQIRCYALWGDVAYPHMWLVYFSNFPAKDNVGLSLNHIFDIFTSKW